ncbi:MAG: tryptophan synthase subunit alpha [Chloroflexi bacterium]|nr:tryptophan synthase subunit alpha [Chloroflexota bacterium]
MATMFESFQQSGRKALMPYMTTGYPQLDSLERFVPAAVEAGADMFELGIPFSDPLADGATIQHATQVALENGVTVRFCLESVRNLRQNHGVTAPFVFMGYYNPILQYGLEKFAGDAVTVGVDGLIVPDLPPEESEELHQACSAAGLDLIFMLAPTSTVERVKLACQLGSGFLYLVSLTGVTGARASLPETLESFVARVRQETKLPLAVGFGISSGTLAQRVATIADGVIVGSAVVQRTGSGNVETVAAFIQELRRGIDQAGNPPAADG